MQIGVLASHGGSNLQALLDASASGALPARICVVLGNNPEAFALERARNAGIPAIVINQKTHPDPAKRDQAICDALLQAGAQWVQLAGYMKMIGPRVLNAFSGRILNIHPAPLPRFGGKGMYGIRVHEAVLASGVRTTGPTIHLVDAAYDTGPLVAHASVPVIENDTAESLASRVLQREHQLLVETWQKIATGTTIQELQESVANNSD